MSSWSEDDGRGSAFGSVPPPERGAPPSVNGSANWRRRSKMARKSGLIDASWGEEGDVVATGEEGGGCPCPTLPPPVLLAPAPALAPAIAPPLPPPPSASFRRRAMMACKSEFMMMGCRA